MSESENKRAWILGKVDRGEISAVEARGVMRLSERQVRRLLSRYREDGPTALSHGNRGRRPAHAFDLTVREKVVELALTKYVGFNQTHFTEKLEEEGVLVSRSSTRRILLEAGIKSPRKRRAPKHRSRRERRSHRGMMLQIDGSRHDWLEGRGPYLTLVGAIDDATGEVPYAQFRLQEDAQGYFLLLEGIVRKYGVPLSLYSDRHGIFVRSSKELLSIEEELRGEQGLTQFGRALKELAIELILALSPQAKGRVERLWGTFQDRLVSELRLAGAKTMVEANEVLEGFLKSYNERFVVEPREKESAYRPLPMRTKLSEVLSFKYVRKVGNDNTVRFEGRVIQIGPGPGGRSYAKAAVIVHEGMDGSVGVYCQGRRIAYERAVAESPVLRVRRLKAKSEEKEIIVRAETKSRVAKIVKTKQSRPARPAAEHPWRQEGLAALAHRENQSKSS